MSLGFPADWGVVSGRTKSWVGITSFPSLRAGPEGLRRFRQSSLTKLVDIPNGLCYPSRRNGNHANAGAAGGQSGQPKLRNAERPMASTGKPQRRARGGRPLGAWRKEEGRVLARRGARRGCELGRVRAASAGLQFSRESCHSCHSCHSCAFRHICHI